MWTKEKNDFSRCCAYALRLLLGQSRENTVPQVSSTGRANTHTKGSGENGNRTIAVTTLLQQATGMFGASYEGEESPWQGVV